MRPESNNTPTSEQKIILHPSGAYDKYLQLPKEWASSPRNVNQLVDIHLDLMKSRWPAMQHAAGWAMAEAAVVATNQSTDWRKNALELARQRWNDTLECHDQLVERGYADLTRPDLPYRLATDSAYLDLFSDMTDGTIRPETLDNLYENVLTIAERNADAHENAEDEEEGEYFVGFAYELNCLLPILRKQDPELTIIPSDLRADSGYYSGRLTHDVRVLRLKNGTIQNSKPYEVKRRVTKDHRSRFLASLIGGRNDIAVPGSGSAFGTLQYYRADRQNMLSNIRQKDLDDIATDILGVPFPREQWEEAMENMRAKQGRQKRYRPMPKAS